MRGAKLGKCCEDVNIIQFFYILWDILDKMKDNLGQCCVKEGFCPFRAELEQLPLISMVKVQFF